MGNCFHFFAGQAIDDPGIPGMLLLNKFQQLIFFFVFEFNPVINIGPVETGDKLSGVLQLKLFDDFLPGYRVGGGGQGNPGNVGETFRKDGQLEIFRTEIMAPLGDAVGFINGKERQGRFETAVPEIRLLKAVPERHKAD